MNEASRTSQPAAVDERQEPVSTNTPTRKRQIDDSEVEPQPKRARLTRKKLTRKNLAAFNKMGRKKNSDPTDDSKSTKTKTTSTTTSGFADKARNNGILDPTRSKPPTNLKDLQKQHARSRETASPPESAYKYYANNVEKAGNEATIVIETNELLKKYDDDGYNRAYNRAFTNLPKNIGFNDGLSAPQPDFVEGLETEEYRPFPVNQHLPGAALYQDDPYSIALPQIAGEWKGPSGDMKEARIQAAYDGAAMDHARAQALAYIGEEDPPGHASITTFATNGTNLNLYAHYAAPAEDDEDTLEYHQYPISSTNLTSSYKDFKKGRKQLRNAQDHAKAQSEQLRDQLKQHWKQNRTKLPPVAEGVRAPNVEPPPSNGYKDASPHVLQEAEEDDYEDDYDADYEIVQPTTPRESSRHSKSSRHHDSRHPSKPDHHHSSQHPSESHHSPPRSSSELHYSPSQYSSKSHHSQPYESSKPSRRSKSPHSSKSRHPSSKTSHEEPAHPSHESHKRKASQTSSHSSSHSSSRHESKRKDYWKPNANGYYYHKHSDGTITWYDDVAKDH